MIIAVSGTRQALNNPQRQFVERKLFSLARRIDGGTIRIGDCLTGVDGFTLSTCRSRAYLHEVFRADWDEYGRGAGPIRNARMLEGADVLYAFPVSSSRGTRNAIGIALDRGIELHVYPLDML